MKRKPKVPNPAYPGRVKTAAKQAVASIAAARAAKRRKAARDNAIRGAVGKPDKAVRVTPQALAKLSDAALARMGLARLGAQGDENAYIVRRRKFRAPDLYPGVVGGASPLPGEPQQMALDSAMVAPTYAWANKFCSQVGFPGYPYLAELALRSEYRAPAETTAKEMTRRWLKFKSASAGDKSDKIKKMEEANRNFHVRHTFRKAIENDAYFGHYQLLMKIKGQDGDAARQRPLKIDSSSLGKDCLEGLVGIEPIWTTPYSYNSTDPGADDFFKPTSWFILGKKTHASRLLDICSRPVPDLFKPAYNFGGLSLNQLMEVYVAQFYKVRDAVAELPYNFSTSGISTNMATLLEEDDSGETLRARAELFNQVKGNRGVMLLDKDTEEFFQFNVPLTSLDKLMAQFQEHMAAPSHTPLVKLLGVSPAGLNASSEGEISVYYDFLHSEQESVLDVPMDTWVNVLQLHLFGKIDPDIVYEWVHLEEPDQAELASIRKSDADAGQVYITNGVISPEEERERLQHDPESGYSNLQGPPPEETPDETLQSNELDHNATQADLDRNHQTQEGEAAREHTTEESEASREHEADQKDADRKLAEKTAAAKAKQAPKKKAAK